MESANDPKRFSILGNYGNKIFWPVAILYGCIIAYAIIDPSGAGATLSSIQRFIIAHFSWLALLTGASAIFFSVWMVYSSRFAAVKLGVADEKPEFSFFAWVAMLSCAALDTGFVISGAVEPLYHLLTAPTVMDAGSAGAVRGVPKAIRLPVVNWGLFGWPPFVVGGRAIGYAAYRHNKPLRTSTGLYGPLGERCNDTLVSKVVDVLAVIGIIGGVFMMIGLGVASISYAFQILSGIELGTTDKFSIMPCFTLTYIISMSTGLACSMRYLNESNGYITLGLLFAVLILGATPFTYAINMIMQVAGKFLFRLSQNLLWTDAGSFEPREWSGSWFIFYILWDISYVPFTGSLTARISRGCTMREFICGTVLVPLFMILLWFSVWGSNSCYEQLKGFLPLWETVQGNPEQALYILLGSFPFDLVLCFIAFICFCLFAVTTTNAASHFIAQQTTNGIEVPRLTMRVFWDYIIGFTGILFQVTGGFAAIKSLAIAAAVPLVFVTFAYIISIVKMMKHDRQQEETEWAGT